MNKQKLLNTLNIVSAITSVLAFVVAFISLRQDSLSFIVLVILTFATCVVGVGIYILRKDYLPKHYDNYWLGYVESDSDIVNVIDLSVKYFGAEYNPSLDILRSWLTVEPRIIRLLHIQSKRVSICGFYLVLCLEKETMQQIADSKLLDWTMDASKLVPFKKAGANHILYVMYVVVDKVSRTHTSVLLADLQSALEQISLDSENLTMTSTMTSTENGERLAIANGFTLIKKLEYPKGWKYWERPLIQARRGRM
jgi:hypothetical protein